MIRLNDESEILIDITNLFTQISIHKQILDNAIMSFVCPMKHRKNYSPV